MVRIVLVLLAAAGFGACAPALTHTEPGRIGPPADFPQQDYLDSAARGEAVYRIDADGSEVVIHAYRSRLGHNHALASRALEGYVRLTGDDSVGQADLYVVLESLTVDEPALVAAAGFDTQPSESDIVGTRANMLVRVLEADKFPYARLRVERVARDATGSVLDATLTLHGATQPLRIPVELHIDARQLTVSGRFALKQSDYGIVPFSILGGILSIRDEVDLRFSVRARRL